MKLCYFGKITTLFLSKKSHIAVKFLKTISTTMCLHQCWTSTFQHYVEEDVRTEVPVYHQISVPVHLVSMDQIAVKVRKLRKTSRRTYIVTHCKQVTAVLTLKLACSGMCESNCENGGMCSYGNSCFCPQNTYGERCQFCKSLCFLYVPSFHPR